MATQHLGDESHRQYIEGIRIAATLLGGPRTYKEILDRCYGYLRPLGFFKTTERLVRNRKATVGEQLEKLRERGWIVKEDDTYILTPQGRGEVNRRLTQLGETGATVRIFLQPRTVSLITVAVHWGLAAVKLPAGLLSGSVGLLNDATDTLLDGLSSLLVYCGIRSGSERSVNMLLVILMLATGLTTLYGAVKRLFFPYEMNVDGFAFLAAILSAIVCVVLWAYQRYVGLRSGMMALITQSVDSRNHVIVAFSVTAGLFAALLRFPLLDTVVGLVVALLILKGTAELAAEVARSLRGEEPDLSRFPLRIDRLYFDYIHHQLHDWMLYLVETQGIKTRAGLVARAHQALDLQAIPAVQALDLGQGQPNYDIIIEQTIDDLFRRGWLQGEEQLSITETGRRHLGRWI